MTRGRPSLRTDELCNDLLTRLASGEPLAQICRDEHMPCVTTVWNWEKADPAFSERIARAREAGHDMIAVDALRIADDGRRDYEKTDDGREIVDHDHIQRSKLRVDTRIKLLSCWDVRYTNKQQVEHSGGVKIETRTREEIEADIRSLIEQNPELREIVK